MTGRRIKNKSGESENVEQWIDDVTDYSSEEFKERLKEIEGSKEYKRYSIRKMPPLKPRALFDTLDQVMKKMSKEGKEIEVFGREHFAVELVPRDFEEYDNKDISQLYNQGYLGREKAQETNTYFTQGGSLFMNKDLYNQVLTKSEDDNSI